jgi:predicted GIY-YIG superfamily endonuclease
MKYPHYKFGNNWFVYMVRCADNSLYTGITNDLLHRICKHNLGKGANYTRSRLPVKLVYSQICYYKSEALKMELHIKSLTKKEKELLIDKSSDSFLQLNPLLKSYEEMMVPVPIGIYSDERYRFLSQIEVDTTVVRSLQQKYSWAVPSELAIKTIVKYSPIVEMGAGTGYWANLIKKSGGDIIAYDVMDRINLYHPSTANSYFKIKNGSPKILSQHTDRSLFLCWPPIGEMALNCLQFWKGKYLILVADRDLSGDSEFYRQLMDFKIIKVISIPTWPNMNDKLYVMERY